MKIKILLTSIICLLIFVGCFEDEGNYAYTKLEEPTWTQNGVISSSFRIGDTAVFRASNHFVWPADSARRASEVTYEWLFGDVVVSNEIDFKIHSDTLCKMIGLTTYDGSTQYAIFSIKEKKTGIAYMKGVWFYVDPSFAPADLYVLSEKDGNAQLSFIARSTRNGLKYELREDIFGQMNPGQAMQGEPLSMVYANESRHISNLGAMEIITSTNRYEVNANTGQFVSAMEYLPFTGDVRLRHDVYSSGYETGTHTFVVDDQGQVYRRMMSANNLAGEFGQVPMYLDTKGYDITHIGQTGFGLMPLPLYDAKNRRVISMIYYTTGEPVEIYPGYWDVETEYNLSKLADSKPQVVVEVTGCAPIWNMPEGTEVLNLRWISSNWNQPDVHEMIYNDAEGNTYLTRFGLNADNGGAENNTSNTNIPFPGGNLTKETVFLGVGAGTWSSYNRSKLLLYNKGAELRYVESTHWTDNLVMTLEDPEDKITCMAWLVEHYTGQYQRLVIGTEKGKLHFYNMQNIANPSLIQTHDLGGRIVAVKELLEGTAYQDKY